MPYSLARQLPTGHYCRKNLGYLEAIRQGANCIFETDDDNAPLPGWSPRTLVTQARTCASAGWVNVYRFFTKEHVWPRGFPLSLAHQVTPDPEAGGLEDVVAPIQQGLVNESTDVDAVWRLVMDRPIYFENRPQCALPGRLVPLQQPVCLVVAAGLPSAVPSYSLHVSHDRYLEKPGGAAMPLGARARARLLSAARTSGQEPA